MSADLSNMIERCANTYRLGREAEASTILQQVINRLTETFEQQPASLTGNVEASIAAALSYQKCNDWVGLADELQYVLSDALTAATSDNYQ